MKPTFDELTHLYATQRLSQYQIALHYGTSQGTVMRWFKSYGIQPLPRQTLASAKPSRCPDHETLQRLYERERLTTRQIGKQFGVSKTEVLRWLIAYGIPRRDAHNGLVNRGQQEPTREELIDLLHVQHLSYHEIGALYSVDPTAISYWIKKHQIIPPTVWDTRRKGIHPVLPTKEELEELYLVQQISLDDIGNRYNVGEGTIHRLCKKYAITRKESGWKGGQRLLCQDGHQVRSTYEQHVDDWLYQHEIPHVYEPPLPFDTRYHADFLANGWYIEIWGVTDNAQYRVRRDKKVQLYHQHGLPLIELGHAFFFTTRKGNLEQRLRRILQPPLG